MLKIPVYLRDSVWYLHTRIEGRQFKRSLKTGDRKTAMLRASQVLQVLIPMTIRKFEIDIGRGIYKSDGEDDHRRMRETLDDLDRLGAFTKTTPQPPEGEPTKKPASGLRLVALVDKFFELRKNLKPATALAYKKSAVEFAGFIGNPIITEIDPSDVTRWQEDLSKFNSVRTIDNKIGNLSSLFAFAIKQKYYFGENPAQGRQLMSKRDRASQGYEIFETSEIKLAFAPADLKKWRAKDPDFYFSTMLAVVSGARISEITSLTAAQIRSEPVPHLKILDSKTQAGKREIPIPQIIFDELLAWMPKSGPIFKYRKRLGKGSGNAVSQKFQRHLKAIEVARPGLVFHSLRKYLNNLCLENEIHIEPRCQFFGHDLENVNVKLYSNRIGIEKMANIFSPIQEKLLSTIGKNDGGVTPKLSKTD